MATPTPIATLGRDAKTAEAVRELLLPDFDVVHTCLDTATAETELPLVCSGQLEAAAQSGLGSNAKLPAGERRVPSVIYLGGGVSDEDTAKLTAVVGEKAPGVRFIRVTRDEVLATGATGPVPEVIAKIFREKFASL
ncbi:hypothetical protein QBC33DRAFT_556171 [Phialemonium atrogriseum]|uniref:Uncharacterized protein n=1 Tax=Phialemonium atrogriseum TaxID=1093897 RepID=A0AAJ0C5S9_9PEZI|nr:uncharacterized protein QBC33DRAFT_556171 [Phialemonium atrogriseum]KAK1770694.1 hypothetical protein QBC33DRAFT_556171 [Phialemonium atrogriseum]